jgi:hypothetical protein
VLLIVICFGRFLGCEVGVGSWFLGGLKLKLMLGGLLLGLGECDR